MSITLTGTFTRLDGSPATGTVRVTPSRSPIMDPDGGVIISGPQTFPLDSKGKISVTLPATNDPSLGEAFTYDVIANMSHANWQIRGLELPSSISTVDLSNPPSGVIREYPTRAEWEAIIDPVVAGAEVAANRAEDAADSAWTAVDTPGRQGPPGVSDIVVDTTVGTRVFANGVMVHGDTGWRTLTSWDTTGTITGLELAGNLSPTPGVAGWIRVRRENNTVTLAIRGLTLGTASQSYTLPAGFIPGALGIRTIAQLDSTNTATVAIPIGSTAFYISPVTEAKTNNQQATIITWPTTSSWPTTLPGTPA